MHFLVTGKYLFNNSLDCTLIVAYYISFRLSFKVRIAGGLFGVILLFTFTTSLVELNTDECITKFKVLPS